MRGPRLSVRTTGLPGSALGLDLGTIVRTRPARPAGTDSPKTGRMAPVGWGSPRPDPADPPDDALIVDLALAPDAILDLDGWQVGGRSISSGLPTLDPAGRRSIELLVPASVPVEVEIVDRATGERLPGRVRFSTADGRYLPPAGHRDEVNPGFYEDSGADLLLGSSAYAYVPGRFDVDLPVGPVDIEVIAGFDRPPYAARVADRGPAHAGSSCRSSGRSSSTGVAG